MIWYKFVEIESRCYIVKFTKLGRGCGCRRVFEGSKAECRIFCEEKNINLGIKNAKKIGEENEE